jgi:lipopolysaccharide transport system permease protein
MLLYQREPWFALLNPVRIVANLYNHRILLWQFIWRNIELQHKGSALGLTWSLLSPLLLFGAYAFVFLAVFDGRFGISATETRLDYAIGLFLGLALLQLFQETMMTAPLVVVQNPNYVKKVVFPLEILPLAAFGGAFFRCLLAIMLVLLAVAIWGPGLSITVLWLPLIVGLLALLSLGLAWTLSALGVFLRDLAPLMQFFSVLLMFMSGVFYSLNRIPPTFSFLRYNPLLVIVEMSRSVVLWHQAPAVGDLVYIGFLSVFFCLFGHLLFCVVKPAFSDVL